MNRIQNILTIVTVSLIIISVVSFSISAVAAAVSTETVVGLFGYIGIYSGLAMLTTGSILSIIALFKTAQELFHHSATTATKGMV